MSPYYNVMQQQIEDERVNQQEFLENAAFSEHYARLKMENAGNHEAYYRYAELEYYHKSRALHFKGLFSAQSTLT